MIVPEGPVDYPLTAIGANSDSMMPDVKLLDRLAALRLLIIGFDQPGHVGSYLTSAAKRLCIDHQIIDSTQAEAGSQIGRSIYWRLGNRRPAHLRTFGNRVVRIC